MTDRDTGGLCKKGLHPMRADNIYRRKDGSTRCRDCLNDYQREYVRRRSQAIRAGTWHWPGKSRG